MKFAELTQEVQVTRPQQVHFDVGLTPGRRRLNMRYKEAVSKAKDSEGQWTLQGRLTSSTLHLILPLTFNNTRPERAGSVGSTGQTYLLNITSHLAFNLQ